MKKFLALLLVASTAFAGERLLGVVSSRNTTKSTAGSAPDAGHAWWDGGYDMPFCIPPMALLTIQCVDPTQVCTDIAACTLQKGIDINAGAIFLTSVSGANVTIPTIPDGGGRVACAQVSVLSAALDGGDHMCSVYERRGNE